MKNFISPEEFTKNSDRVPIYAGDAENEKDAFLSCHLPGSYFLHLEDDLTGDSSTGKGRHPLPEMNAFADKVMELGISTDTKVLLYGDGLTMAAYRLWWMLKAVGVEDVKFLYDPEAAWKAHGTADSTPVPEKKGEGLAFDPRSIMEMSEIRRSVEREDITLIDSRDAERYRGEKDEMDRKPGHIPTALSYPYEALQTDEMPDGARIREHFGELPGARPLVVYCGSGVSAPFNMMLLDEIGIPSKLYPGSFSGWIEDEDNPVVSD